MDKECHMFSDASKKFVVKYLCWNIPHLSVQAEEVLSARRLNKEYLPIPGNSEFTRAAAKLAYGADSVPFLQNSVRSPLHDPYFVSISHDIGFHRTVHLGDRCAAYRWHIPCQALFAFKGYLPSRAFLGQPHTHIPRFWSRSSVVQIL
jgi:hypothetical protein